MKGIVLKLIGFFLVGFIAVLGMRAGEYLIEKPPTRLLICFANDEQLVGNCKPFEDYVKGDSGL